MIEFREIAKAKVYGDAKTLYESSLGRVWQHFIASDEKSFAIVTSWRASNTKKQNLADMRELKNEVRSMGYGFISLKGHWKECQNTEVSYEDCPEEDLIDTVEPSLFVIGATVEEIKSLSNKYNQDAYVFAGPETDGEVVLRFRDGNQIDIGKFKPQSLGQAYSELIKSKLSAPRYFKFEGIEYPAQTWIENLIEQEIRKILV